MGIEFVGIFGLLILIADIWAIVSTISSNASTGAKVLWILLILIFPDRRPDRLVARRSARGTALARQLN